MALSVHRPDRAMDDILVARFDVIPLPSALVSSMNAPHRAVAAMQTGANPDDVPAEDGGAPLGASPGRRSIFTFVHGRGPIDFLFILDSGASEHATPRYYLLQEIVPVAAGQSVRAANGKDVQVRGRGRVCLENFITLDDVAYIPGLVSNIVSVSKLVDLDHEEQFTPAGCFVRDARADGALVGSGRRVHGVFVLDYLFVQPGRTAASAPQQQGPAAH